jgi:hypothetical protein
VAVTAGHPGCRCPRWRSLLAPPVSIAPDRAEAAIRRISDLSETEKNALVSYLRTLRDVASNGVNAC